MAKTSNTPGITINPRTTKESAIATAKTITISETVRRGSGPITAIP